MNNENNNTPRRTYLKRSNLNVPKSSGVKSKEQIKKQQELIKKQLVKQINKDLQKETNKNKQNNNKTNTKNNKPMNNGKALTRNTNHIKVVNKKNITPQNQVKNNNKKLKLMFLGGLGEVGKNMMALEYGNDIIIIDAGSAFPGEDLPGIDLIVPDISYITQNKHKIRAIVLTHGHEDHIGGLPYLLPEVNVPIYGSRMALALVEKKLREHRHIKPTLKTVKAGQKIKINNFSVEFIHVNHSIAGAFALAIKTPVGTWLHTGDFKVDFTPIDCPVINLPRFAELGKEGVLLLTADSTNSERPGYTMSESTVGKGLDALFATHSDKRIFVATFASNIYRLQQLIDLAVKYKRKIALTGRSMLSVIEVAAKIGELKIDKSILIPVERVKNYPKNEILILTTGSQGEPFSALTRMAAGEFKKVTLDENDAVIFSSSAIPGNEKAIGRVMNNLYKTGCEVVYDKLAEVHVSGHAKMEELKLIHSLVKPKFFIPAHGEYRMLKKHVDLAVNMGMNERNTLIAEIGSKIEFTKTTMKLGQPIPAGRRLVDGLGFGDMESIVLRDRKLLAEDGLCVVMLGINNVSGELTSGPDIITRGFMYSDESNSIINGAKEVVVKTLKDLNLKEGDWGLVKGTVKKTLGNHFYRKTKRRPMILTFVLEN